MMLNIGGEDIDPRNSPDSSPPGDRRVEFGFNELTLSQNSNIHHTSLTPTNSSAIAEVTPYGSPLLTQSGGSTSARSSSTSSPPGRRSPAIREAEAANRATTQDISVVINRLANGILDKLAERVEADKISKYPYKSPILAIEMPIQELDGLRVKTVVTLRPYSHKSIEFSASSRDIFDCDTDDMKLYFKKTLLHEHERSSVAIKYSLDEIEKSLTEIYVLLPLIRFNKLLGTLETSTPVFTANDWYNFLNHTNVLAKMNECSVCGELTETKTSCNHSLCYVCWELIPLPGNPDDDQPKPCPLCRADIRYVQHSHYR